MVKKMSLLISGLVLLMAVVLGFVYFLFDMRQQDENVIQVYFFNAARGKLEAEFHVLPADWEVTGNDLFLQAAFNFVFREPISGSLSRPWPDVSEIPYLIYRYYLDEDVLIAEFKESYLEIYPLTEALLRSALTLTMTALPFVNAVEVRVLEGNGEKIRVFSETAASVANAPMISPAQISDQTVTLFFVHESGEGLIYMDYVAPAVNMHFRNQVIFQKLISHQNIEGVLPSIPSGTHILSINEHEHALAVYVNLSNEFFTGFSGDPFKARLMIASIVNTLLENSEARVRRVFFFIESERREEFHGVSDFDLGFYFDESIIIRQEYEDITPPETEPEDEEDLPEFDELE